MNDLRPNSPEDLILDNLLHEQAKGADPEFLNSIERAIDEAAQPVADAERIRPRPVIRWAIAASVVLSATGLTLWQWPGRTNDLAVLEANPSPGADALARAEAEYAALLRQLREQEMRVEEKRKVLNTIVETKGIVYKGGDSIFGGAPPVAPAPRPPIGPISPGDRMIESPAAPDRDMVARSATMSFEQLEQEKVQLESQIQTLLKYDNDQLVDFAAGLNLPENTVRRLQPQYATAKQGLVSLKASGLGENHPRVRAQQEIVADLGRQLDQGVASLRDTLRAQLDLTMERLSKIGVLRKQGRELAVRTGLDTYDFVEARQEFEQARTELDQLRLRLQALEIRRNNSGNAPAEASAEASAEAPAPEPEPKPDPNPEPRKPAPRPARPDHRNPPPADRGNYPRLIDQPWESARRTPLSTFSVDVDTASYSNIRRMIREDRGVPADAVRIEECINAFSYDYPAPQGEGPFTVTADMASCPWQPRHHLARVALKGREFDPASRPASNLVFLVDVSGSMQSPDKLPLLIRSMLTLVDELDQRDRVGIVVYAGREGVVLPSTALDADGRDAARQALQRLRAGGSTNGGAGLVRAYDMASGNQISNGVNRVILATDGDFNVGVTGQGSLVDLVKDRAREGVSLTVLGFGTGNLNDSMLEAITNEGNGNYFYIDSEHQGRKVLARNLAGTLVTIAKDVKVQVEFNPAKVGAYRLIGYANRLLRPEDFNNDRIDAGDIGAGHTVTAFYEITLPDSESVHVGAVDKLKYSQPSDPADVSAEWMTVKLRYKHPDGDTSRRIEMPVGGAVPDWDRSDPEFQFATAVALFGMKLRGIPGVSGTPWSLVERLAQAGLARDPAEERAEFVGLVRQLTREAPPEDLPPGAVEAPPAPR